MNFLDFERPIAELEGKLEELRHLSDDGELNIAEEVSRLQGKADRLLRQTYASLTPWQKTQVARHPERPRSTTPAMNCATPLTAVSQSGGAGTKATPTTTRFAWPGK